MKNNNYYAIIMAGGIGSRFWPMSTEEYPKQFHDMLGVGSSLIQKTFNRFESIIPPENILISTNKRYKNLVKEQLDKVTDKQLLLEPTMRNTAPCILYAALKIYNQNPEAVMIVAPSDHWIDDEATFIKNALNKSQLEIDFRDTGLHKFQETAFSSAFAYLESLNQRQEPKVNPYEQD